MKIANSKLKIANFLFLNLSETGLSALYYALCPRLERDKHTVKQKVWFLIFVYFTCIYSFSQVYTVNGVVVDSLSRSPLPFVNIVVNDGPSGTITNIDGKFVIKTQTKPQYLKLSYVGYFPVTVNVDEPENMIIEMTKSIHELEEVVILPGENPAHRIINNAILHRKINNPMNLKSFSYTSYNRFFVSPDLDIIREKAAADTDTIFKKYAEFLEKHYLFLMESISERKYISPDLSEEKIIASRVAGFSNPLFTVLMTQLQSFSFYGDLISISDKNYVNPISNNSTEKYFFLLEDTLFDEKDTVFIISFRPRKGKNFDALKGALYIHSDKWAIQNVIASPARDEKGFAIRIQQQYERIDNNRIWFPTQLNTEILFKNISVNKLDIYGIGRSYLVDIKINPDLKKRHFSDAQIIFEDTKPQEDILNKFQAIFGSHKDSTTYAYIDSIGKEHNFDRMLGLMRVMLSARLPVFIFDVPLFSLVNNNNFEGWRLGLALETNNRLMRNFSIGGYTAYGFKDKATKYGAFIQYNNRNLRDVRIRLSHSYDVKESGGKQFFDFQQILIDPASYRNFLVVLMDFHKEVKLEFSGIAMRHTYLYASINDLKITSPDEYLFGSSTDYAFTGTRVFYANIVSFGIKYNPNISIVRGLDEISTLFPSEHSKPELKIEFQKGLDFFEGVTFNAVDVWLKKQIFTKYYGNTEIVITAGITDREVPYPFLRVIPASYRKFGLYIPYSFPTARMNEFVSDTYAYMFLQHNFKKLLLRTKYFSPQFSIALNYAVGKIENPKRHKNRTIASLEKGLFETGIIANNIVNVNLFSLGFAVFCRIGYYSFAETKDNFSFMISLSQGF